LVFDEREIRKRDKRLPPSRGGMTTMSVEHFGDDVDRGKYADGRTYNEARNGACTELAALTKPLMRGRSSPHERSDMRD
jgi:hypothetical protein